MFLVLNKLVYCIMFWRGFDEYINGNVMFLVEEMYGEEYKFIVGFLRLILDESEGFGCGKLNK